MPTERPILFSAPMVRAILDGSKTQTRRVVKFNPWPNETNADCHRVYKTAYRTNDGGWGWVDYHGDPPKQALGQPGKLCPYGQPGDRLWVRESFQYLFDTDRDMFNGEEDMKTGAGYKASYPATDGIQEFHDVNTEELSTRVWPSIHMPRWASRILLEVTDARVERVQAISEVDALAEGVKVDAQLLDRIPAPMMPARDAFRQLWDSINAPRGFGWYANPWTWAITFKRVKP